MELRAGTRVGAYELRPMEGRGGTAEVYRALDTRLSREVALKVIADHHRGDPKAQARLEREARILASLSHPHIARVHGLTDLDGIQALVLELVEGPTLADRLAAGPLAQDDALVIARQIAMALESAHERGVVHRDLKPSNIKFSSDGAVKVLDFGLARLVRPQAGEGDGLAATITQEGLAVGTAAYMSPEQARGHAVDERADIWAFGCVLYEMLTGERAFPGSDTASTLAAVLRSEPDWSLLPGTLSPTIRVYLQRCLSKEPAERIRHIGDVRLAIDGRLDPERPPAVEAPVTRGRSRWHVAAWVIAALVAGAAATASLTWLGATGEVERAFVIHAPDGARFGEVTMEPYPALSPDGQQIAYVAATDRGTSVWVQRVGDLSSRQLPGTERMGRPFWSPDGTFVAVGGARGLRTIAIAGDSAPQTVCECPATDGGAWSRDGTILFSHRVGLSRVAASGGTPVPVTTIDESRGEFAHQFPQFLPDGRRFLYLIRSDQAERRGIYLASIDHPGNTHRLLPDDSNVDIGEGADGSPYLFFVRDVTLVAQPFDFDRGELTGSPILIAPRVVPGEGGRFAPFAAGGRTIVFRQTTAPRTRLRWFDRRGLSAPGSELAGSFRYVSLSPDGSRLAVSQVDPQTTKLDLWMHDLRRGVSERLTSDPVGAFFPVWTPDASRVLYASAREGPWHLFWRSPTSPDTGRLYAAVMPFTKYPDSVTPDGRWLLFNGDGVVWRLSLTEPSKPIRVVAGLQGHVSPDGRWLAYASAENGPREVYVSPFPEAQTRVRISVAGGSEPQWRADGGELFFFDADQTLMAATLTTGQRLAVRRLERLFRARLDPRTARYGPSYAVHPDGQRFLINEAVDDQETLLTVLERWGGTRP